MTVSETKVTSLPDIYRKAAEELGYQLVDVNGESQIGISLGYIEIFFTVAFMTLLTEMSVSRYILFVLLTNLSFFPR